MTINSSMTAPNRAARRAARDLGYKSIDALLSSNVPEHVDYMNRAMDRAERRMNNARDRFDNKVWNACVTARGEPQKMGRLNRASADAKAQQQGRLARA